MDRSRICSLCKSLVPLWTKKELMSAYQFDRLAKLPDIFPRLVNGVDSHERLSEVVACLERSSERAGDLLTLAEGDLLLLLYSIYEILHQCLQRWRP